MTITERVQIGELAPAPLVPSRVEEVVRAADQLRLTIELINLDVDPASNTLVRVDRTEKFAGARLIFGSQHTVEDTISTTADTPTEEVDHRTARDSRLVFALPEGTPYALSAILDLAARALALDPRAIPGSKSKVSGEPTDEVTALEVVESLIFSPDPDGRFTAATEPITRADVTELWRARLEPDPSEPTVRPKLRAIFSRPGDPAGLDRPVKSEQRDQIVAANLIDPGDPMQVDRLWLTSQGSFLDLTGEWVGISLASYLHRSTAGRDLHVEVVERGYLAPFGLPATITTVTERQFRTDVDGGTSAILIQDDYLAVSADTVTFGAEDTPEAAPHMPDSGRATPFTAVRVAASGAGPVGKAAITLADGTTIDTANAWVVTRDGADAPVTYSATDRAGRGDISFDLPAIFVTDRHAYTTQDEVNGVTTPLGNLAAYFAEAPGSRVEPDLGGQPVGWADPDPRGKAGSDRVTSSIRIGLDRPDLDGASPSAVRAELEAAGRPAFYPRVEHAFVIDEATSALIGGDGGAVKIRYATSWLEHGNEEAGNPGLAFHTLDVPSTVQKSGNGSGLVRPSLKVTTYSQTLGAGVELTADDPRRARGGDPTVAWNPLEALADAAELFGSIKLTDIIEAVANLALNQLEGEKGMPRFEVLVEDDGIHYVMTWEPKLKPFSIGGEPVFVPGGEKRAILRLEQLIPIDNATAAGTEFELVLNDITLRSPPAVPAIEIDFRRLRYHEPMGGTGQLESDLRDWKFIEVLAFLEPVRQIIVTLLDLGDIEIGPDGITADVELPVPKLALGVVGVTGLKVGLLLDLPNAGESKIGFNLSRRDDPFRITVMGFGGTGSLELGLLAKDIDFLYAELGVTYELAVSLAIVSASLSASLGLELAYELSKTSGEREVTISAYVELVGNASVLGLVNLTGKVLLALRYTLETKLLKGTAKVSAEVDSIFGKTEASWKETVEVSLGSGDNALTARGTTPLEPPAACR